MENNQFPTFENFREETKANEAMVQVAGKSKPSGALVLATVLIDYMEERDFLKPGMTNSASMKKGLIQDLQKFIMDNTF